MELSIFLEKLKQFSSIIIWVGTRFAQLLKEILTVYPGLEFFESHQFFFNTISFVLVSIVIILLALTIQNNEESKRIARIRRRNLIDKDMYLNLFIVMYPVRKTIVTRIGQILFIILFSSLSGTLVFALCVTFGIYDLKWILIILAIIICTILIIKCICCCKSSDDITINTSQSRHRRNKIIARARKWDMP